MKPDGRITADLAPMGVMRVVLNLGNPLLVTWNDLAAAPIGLSVDLATELSRRLMLPLKFVCFPGAGKVFEATSSKVWDIAFPAVDPARSKEMNFTNPYVTLSGSFVVQASSAFTKNEETDVPGVRIVVGKGRAYDLYLSSTIKHAEIVRVPTLEACLPRWLVNATRLRPAFGNRSNIKREAIPVCVYSTDSSR